VSKKESKGFLGRVADWIRDKDGARKKAMKKRMGRREAGKKAGRMIKELFE